MNSSDTAKESNQAEFRTGAQRLFIILESSRFAAILNYSDKAKTGQSRSNMKKGSQSTRSRQSFRGPTHICYTGGVGQRPFA